MESDWIRGFALRLGAPPPRVLRGIGDDAACLQVPEGQNLLWTTDSQREGVHFRWDWMSPEDVGYRLFIANLSDILAKGGVPYAALSAIGVPAGFPEADLMSFYEGLAQVSHRFDCPVVGGDIARSPDGFNAVLSLLGTASPGRFPGREGLSPGDSLFLVGTPGLARAGYLACRDCLFSNSLLSPAIEAFRRPRTYPWMADFVREEKALSAAMDTSDGLGQAVFEMAFQSGVSVLLDPPPGWLAHLEPFAGLLGQDPFRLAWQGGEDYDLLLGLRGDGEAGLGGLPVNLVSRIERCLEGTPARIVRIGSVIAGKTGDQQEKGAVLIKKPDGSVEPLERVGFDHTRN